MRMSIINILTGPREGGPHMSCRALEEVPGFGQVAEDRSEGTV